jgi:hypothetical protein
MRRVLLFFFVAVFCAARAFAAQPEAAVVLTAQQIALYADRGLLIADGGVSVQSGSMHLTATRASYDLRTNTLTAIGQGEAFVYDFKKKSGSTVPGATVPQISTSEALALGSQVELHPGTSIAFSNAQVRSGSTFAPQASYLYAIPPPNAKDFGYSPVPSAALEWPFLLTSASDAYTFARARFDRYNGGPGAGLEEHYARTDRGYAALGETFDADGARFDFASYQRLNESLSQTLTGTSLIGTRALRYAIASSTSRGYASLSFSQYDGSRSDELLLSGNQHALSHAGSVRFQVVLGHDVHPGDAKVAQDFRITPALHFDTATLHAGTATFSGSVDLGESLYNYGRGTLASTLSAWSNLPVNRHLTWNGGVTFSHDAPPFPSTYRTYVLGSTWKASDAFNLVSSLTYTHDYGQAFGTGRPMFGAAFDVRVRRRNGTGIEVGALLPFGGAGDMHHQAGLNLRFFK